jgi:hypothetical protein
MTTITTSAPALAPLDGGTRPSSTRTGRPVPLAIPVKTYARIAGSLYLVIAVFGGFSVGYVPSIIVSPGDAALTATNLMANQGLFAMGVFADVVVMLSEIGLSVMLFVLFRPTSATLSMIAMVSRLTMVVVMAVNPPHLHHAVGPSSRRRPECGRTGTDPTDRHAV